MYVCSHHPQEVAGARKQIAFKSPQAIGVDAGTTMTDRLTMEDDLSITISPVMVEDERIYICQVTAGALGFSEDKTQIKVFCKSDWKWIQIIPSLLA